MWVINMNVETDDWRGKLGDLKTDDLRMKIINRNWCNYYLRLKAKYWSTDDWGERH